MELESIEGVIIITVGAYKNSFFNMTKDSRGLESVQGVIESVQGVIETKENTDP